MRQLRKPWHGHAAFLACGMVAALIAAVPAQEPPASPPPETTTTETGEKLIALKFNAAPLAQVLQFYSDLTGRTLLEAPNVNATITLRSQSKLTTAESLQAIRTVLAMNNVGLVELGEKFAKVVPIGTVQQEGLTIQSNVWERMAYPESDEVISEIIPLRFIDIAEAQKVMSTMLHGYGKVMALDRINSLLVVETAVNLNRIHGILDQIDQPLELKEKLHILTIRYSKASEIKAKIEEIIAEAEEKGQQPTVRRPRESGPPGVEPKPTPSIPGVIRAPRPTVAPAPAGPTVVPPEEVAEEGKLIRGSVKMVADDRTGLLLIITRPENMTFFEEVAAALDVPTAPDVMVEVIQLEYADVESVATMLNNLIGATATSKEPPKTTAAKPGETPAEAEAARAATLQEFLRQQREAALPAETKTKVGQLAAENIKILSDKRTNALIIMASQGDMATLKEIITSMDIMLSQVLIEAVILEITLGRDLKTGVDWIQRSMIAYNEKGGGQRTPLFAFGGGGGGDYGIPRDAATLAAAQAMGAGLTYYLTYFGLNIDAVIKLASTDNRTRVLSAPVILTTDNTEAKITSTEQVYVYAGKKYDQHANVYDDYTTKDIGLELTVKPQINKNKFVMMQITQNMSEPGDTGQPTSGAKVSSTRTLNASIGVSDGQTIVLGGQVRQKTFAEHHKIPLLGDIPLLGRLFNYALNTSDRREMVVFITPHVLNTTEDIEAESRRRKEAMDVRGLWKRGWSKSQLAEPARAELRAEHRHLHELQRREAAAERLDLPGEPGQDAVAGVATNAPAR